MSRIEKLIKNWTGFSVIISNFVLVFIFLNLAVFVARKIKHHFFEGNDLIKGVGHVAMNTPGIYDGWKKEDIIELYKETSRLQLEVEPFSMFGEQKGFQSRYINISKNGYRNIENQEDIQITTKPKVFIFGSSPIFGYGTADRDTVASQLQKSLNGKYAVFNFGRGYYYSRQELSLLLNLILDKQWVPKIVIFLNNHANERGLIGPNIDSAYTYRAVKGRRSMLLTEFFPFIDFIQSKVLSSPGQAELNENKSGDVNKVNTEINYFFRVNAIVNEICKNKGIKFYSIYGPAPEYKYGYSEKNPFRPQETEDLKYERLIFSIIDEKFHRRETPDYFYWLADLGEKETRPLYVDGAHYNAYFSKKIAKEVAKKIVK